MIQDGTAVGMGIANAVSRLKESKAKSKVIILLTDGTNNAGDISPLTAADIAKSFGIRVYTIGVGTNGTAPYPMPVAGGVQYFYRYIQILNTTCHLPYPMPVAGGVQYLNVPVEIDSKTLAEIAEKTDGKFYRATDNESLNKVYADIDQLEKSKMKVKQYNNKTEVYFIFALIALVALLMEFILRITILKRIP